MSEQELAGKVAVVAGVGRDSDRTIALKLARSGAAVVINVNANEANEVVCSIEDIGGKAAIVPDDVIDPKVAAALAATALARFGRIDVLVNNAAMRRDKTIVEMTCAEWRAAVDGTLDSAFHCVKACLPALRKNGGAVVNVGCVNAHIGGAPGAYMMTENAGLVGLTRGLAHDLAADGIAVNCVVPGPRDDIAALVHFLCTPAAHYVTGQTVQANGGAYLRS